MFIYMSIRQLLNYIKYSISISFCDFTIDCFYGDFFQFRKQCIVKPSIVKNNKYFYYLKRHNSFIGLNTYFASPPILPHGMSGIYISDQASIGKDVTILQQVTIGSNTIYNHPQYGAPTIGDNVFIGAGAKIIGNVKIGNNCRIGANCVVVKDMPDNTTAVLSNIKYITKNEIMNNKFHGINEIQTK